MGYIVDFRKEALIMKYILISKAYKFVDEYHFDLVVKLTNSQVKEHADFMNGFNDFDDNDIHYFEHGYRYGWDFNHKYGIQTFDNYHLLNGWFANSELTAKDIKNMKRKNDIVLPIDNNINKNIHELIDEINKQNKVLV